MAKTKISEFDSNPVNNTDIDGINLAEGMAPGLVNNAIRELMAQLKDFQAGLASDNVSVGGNLSVTGTTTLTGAATLAGRAIDAFPSGTKLLFNQTTAPTGWVKDTTHDNKALRVVSGTAGTGGSIAFTTAFASQNVGDTTLTASQIPSHTHTFSDSGTTGNAGGHTHSVTETSHSHGIAFSGSLLYSGGGGNPNTAFGGGVNQSTVSASTGISINAVGDHAHSVSISGTTGALGGSTAHSHTINLAVQYVDVIICTKS